MELLLPRVREPELILPSYVKLDMAFGVGSGSILFDKSRYRSHGAITGAAWETGVHGFALDFIPGRPSIVTIDAAYDQLNFTSEDFSIIARINSYNLDATRVILSRGKGNVDGWYYTIRTTGQLRFYTDQSGASVNSRSSVGAIVIGTDYTVGISRTGSSVKIYVDGVEDTDTVGTHINPVTSARDFEIGYSTPDSYGAFDGLMEFLLIFGGISLPEKTHLAWHNALK